MEERGTSIEDLVSLLKYDEFEDDPNRKASEYKEKLNELDERQRNLKTFFEGSISMFLGDDCLNGNDFDGALDSFQKSSSLLSRFLRYQESGEEMKEQDEFLSEAKRRLIYVSGRLNEIEAKRLEKDSADRCAKKWSDASKSFEEEEALCEITKNVTAWANARTRKVVARANAYRVLSQKFKDKGSLNKALKTTLQALRLYKHAAFLHPKFKENAVRLIEEVPEMTRVRLKTFLMMKAEENWQEGISFSDKGNFEKAMAKFKNARKIHARASEFALADPEREIMRAHGLIYAASEKEAMGNYYMRMLLDPKTASVPFKEASQIIDDALNAARKTGNELLIESFDAQREYYLGMSIHCKALGEFDSKNYEIANQLFSVAEQHFKTTELKAKKCQNEPLIKLVENILSETQGYAIISSTMAKTMIE